MTDDTNMVSNQTKATATGGVLGLGGALAGWASVKYHLPIEVVGPVAMVLTGWLGRWAAKLEPHG